MRTDCKIRIYKSCIRPIMTYGKEVREDINKTKSVLRVAEMKTLKITVGENEERRSEKHRHQRTMRITKYSEVEKAE